MQIQIFTRDNLSKKSPVLIAVPKPVALFISETMLDHFGLNLISDPLRFETQGLLSENFLVKTKAGQKVVKWRKGGTQTRERLVKELELTEKVGNLGLQVSVPLKNSSNQYVHSDSNNCFACFDFIEGDYFKGSEEEMISAANGFSKFTKALEKVNTERIYKNHYKGSISCLKKLLQGTEYPATGTQTDKRIYFENRKFLLGKTNKLEVKIDQLKTDIRLCHTDFHPLNLLFDPDGTLKSILDFEDVKPYPLMASLGFACYKLTRQFMSELSVSEQRSCSELCLRIWETEWKKIHSFDGCFKEKLREGATLRVLELIQVILEQWFKRGNLKLNFDLQKQIRSLYEIDFIYAKGN